MPDPFAVIVQGSATGTPLPVSGAVGAQTGTFTDRSGTITTGGVSQQIAAANATRKFFFIQNVSDTDLWVNFTAAANADQPSVKIPPDASLAMDVFVSTEAINVFGVTTGKAFTAKEG